MTEAWPEAKTASAADDRIAERLRGFGLLGLGLAAMLVVYLGNSVFVPLTAILVLVWAWRSRTPWRAIGFARPESWVRTLIIGLASSAQPCSFHI